MWLRYMLSVYTQISVSRMFTDPSWGLLRSTLRDKICFPVDFIMPSSTLCCRSSKPSSFSAEIGKQSGSVGSYLRGNMGFDTDYYSLIHNDIDYDTIIESQCPPLALSSPKPWTLRHLKLLCSSQGMLLVSRHLEFNSSLHWLELHLI